MEWSVHKRTNYHALQWVQNQELIDTLVRRCGTGETVIELGCGTGVLIGHLAGAFRRCVGLDPLSDLLERAPKEPNIEYVQKHLEDVEYGPEFDCVIMRNILHHLRDPEEGIAIAARILRPGGRLVICEGVPPHRRVLDFYTRLFALLDDRHILTEGDIIAMLRLQSFREVEMQLFFMEGVDLLDWLSKVCPDKEVFNKALDLHQQQDGYFKRVYEVVETPTGYQMTWRFVIFCATRI